MTDALYSHTVPLLYATDVYDSLSKHKNIVLFDARQKEEYNVSHLPGAIYVGYDEFDSSKIKHIDKNKTIIVYCSVGYRSEKIGEKLKDLGFKNVYNLYGGIFDWKNNGYPVVDNCGKETEKVHPYNDKWGVWLKKGVKSYE
jgi:rhodanese-related sulfurtransferase